MPDLEADRVIRLETIDRSLWDRFYTIAPLVIIGSREEQRYDLAPKHMVTPLGWGNYFAFVCTPSHATYRNIQENGAFTVTYPRPEQVVLTSLTAAPRCDAENEKPVLDVLTTFRASEVDGVFVEDGYLFLECELARIIDGFDQNSLVVGRIVAAHARESALRASDIDDRDLLLREPLLAYLNPGRYARIADTFAFPFPEGFKR